MCANNQTLAAVTGIRDDRDAAANKQYANLLTRARRAALYGTDQEAADRAEAARRFAHRESVRGNYGPLIDQLQRALAD